MPEGDTIYRAARALGAALAGRRVVAFETALAPLARVNDDTPLTGRTVERVESRGKWCLLWFSPPPAPAPGAGPSNSPAPELILLTHMLMSGSWHLYRPGERWRMPHRDLRIVLRVQGREGDPGWEAVAFNVPVAEFHTPRSLARHPQLPQLGPDILAPGFTAPTGIERLQVYIREHPQAEVGPTLLNQRVLAGLGNVYKSEVAFAAGVNPWRTLATLTPAEIERLVDFALRYMRANVAPGAREGIVTAGLLTTGGNRRTTRRMNQDERLWVYGRQGQECRRCGATVLSRKQGAQARSTFWCPQCQPWPDESPAPAGNAIPSIARRRATC